MAAKLLLLALVVLAMVGIGYFQRIMMHKIRPKSNFYRFVIFIVVQAIAILLTIVLMGRIIIYFKDFFFKR